jgi:antitoxin component of MazEF toxin-antitoxin module
MLKAKITRVGNSAVVLPKEALARLKVKKGDTLFWSRRHRAMS